LESDHPIDQYVLLVDLLGFSPAVMGWDDGRKGSLLELMRWIARGGTPPSPRHNGHSAWTS